MLLLRSGTKDAARDELGHCDTKTNTKLLFTTTDHERAVTAALAGGGRALEGQLHGGGLHGDRSNGGFHGIIPTAAPIT